MNPYSNLVQSTTDKIRIEISEFHPDGKVPEWHVMLHPRQHTDSFPEQLSDILTCIPVLKQKLGKSVILRFARCFMSDASNQQQLVKKMEPKPGTERYAFIADTAAATRWKQDGLLALPQRSGIHDLHSFV